MTKALTHTDIRDMRPMTTGLPDAALAPTLVGQVRRALATHAELKRLRAAIKALTSAVSTEPVEIVPLPNEHPADGILRWYAERPND